MSVSITVDGVKFEAETQEQLDATLAKLKIQSPTPAKPPKPKAKAAPAPSGKHKPPEKWDNEKTLTEMEKDIPGTIMKVVAQQLGIDSLQGFLNALSDGISATYGVAQESLVSQALRANNVEPTAEAIEDFSNILAERPGDKQTPTFENFSAITKDAIGKDWLSRSESLQKESEKETKETKSTDDGTVKEPVLQTRGKSEGLPEGKAGKTSDGGSSEAELEADLKNDPEGFMKRLHAAQRETVQ